MDKNSSTSGGVGVLGLLGVAFIVLKLCKVIDWSWWWVLCPFWGPVVLVVSVGAIFLLGYAALHGIFSSHSLARKWYKLRRNRTK